MKYIIIALLIVPNLAFAKVDIYREALSHMGVTTNEATDPISYKQTWEALDKLNKGQKFNLVIRYRKSVTCSYEPLAVGCYWIKSGLIELVEHPKHYSLKKNVLHEYAHSIGIIDEAEANKFADKYK